MSKTTPPRAFHHREFSDLNQLESLKRDRGVSVSVVIPTLNEERSIAEVVGVLAQTLQQRHQIIDEILVVDSGSTDETRDRARRAGAHFVTADSILPELPPAKGKGENLWKSLSIATGDLICFVDGDISNIHPRFVYGLIGPLLEDRNLDFVKAFYERPMASGSGILPNQGGRVTELLVRPVLSLFYPALALLNQPLAGEYAARKSLLEALPFPTGYGVETALLIDTLRLRGPSCFAQVDLEERIHRNRSLNDLSTMSFEILHTLLPRLESDGFISNLVNLPKELLRPNGDQHPFHLQNLRERPPLKELLKLRL